MILNLMKVKPRHGEELAELLMLKPATISHHLSILAAAGLVGSQKEQYYQVYSQVGDRLGYEGLVQVDQLSQALLELYSHQ